MSLTPDHFVRPPTTETLLARIEAIEARQRAAGQHDPGCQANTVLGPMHVDTYTGGGAISAYARHPDSGRFSEANSEETGDPQALAIQRLKDDIRDHAPEWFRPCTCWLSRP